MIKFSLESRPRASIAQTLGQLSVGVPELKSMKGGRIVRDSGGGEERDSAFEAPLMLKTRLVKLCARGVSGCLSPSLRAQINLIVTLDVRVVGRCCTQALNRGQDWIVQGHVLQQQRGAGSGLSVN